MKAVLLSVLILSLPLCADIEIRKDPSGKVILQNSSPAMAARRTASAPSSASNTHSYAQLIHAISSHHGVDPRLVTAVCRAESSFNPGAVSKKGAVGLMQLMPDTARQYGVTDRTDPTQNLTAGIRHLKYLQDKYQSLPLTLAAYNAGEEPVKKYRGIPPYPETRQYIARIMSFLGLPYNGSPARSKIFLYRQPNGRILLTDSPMPASKGYQALKK